MAYVISDACISCGACEGTCPAGDAFIGAFCTRICTDDSIGKVLTIANYTAALSIATEGAIESLPTSKQVREYMEQKRDA